MVALSFRQVLIFVLCCQIPFITATFLIKDLAIAAILGGILKPRFIPLPIPLPIPFTINKHIRKPYPVPIYSHSFAAHQVNDVHPGSLGDLYQQQHFGASQALAQLQTASENIDSWVQQLSLNSGALKVSHSNNIPIIQDGSFNEFDADFSNIHGSEDWW
ncbi:uncharacterized protein CEXT_442021 [Caerostris extrusa]|uniref:Uncharacterized protein n=1 Tax=Caerostris extrusa TaxID=172846 RepID=A0AAV4YAG1_CAEEX|nr:uncharacterized protein CEXT_442021 [Caerostris extrusa]